MQHELLIVVSVLSITGCTPSVPARLPAIVERQSPAIGGSGAVQEAVGLETLGGILTPLLQVGCPVPCVTASVFSTTADNQDQISIRLFRGAATMAADATFLGTYRIEGIPPMPRGQPQVEVRLAAEGQDLIMEANDAETGCPYRIFRVE